MPRRWLAMFVLSVALLGAAPSRAADKQLLIATTTSVRDSGLLDELLPDFERESGVEVQVVAVGSGAALRMGSSGDADLLITHAPSAEKELVEKGALAARRPFMENHFVLAGPPEDPADVAGADSASEAYRRLAAAGAPYASRGDDSGTHRRERDLMRAAGLDPDSQWDGFLSTGAGMGLTLQVAGERRAYVLSDLGTFLAFQERTGLVPHSKAEESLRNVYSVLRVNPERFPGIHADAALALESYLLRSDVQERIGRFGADRFGRALFRPLARPGP